MIITKKALPRRPFLRGAGATLALPLLDAMIPAATAATRTALRPVRRLGYVFMPMGCDQSRWTPPGADGRLGELSPILRSLEPVKDKLTVLTNLELERVPGLPRDLQLRVHERRQGEADGELRLSPRHDRRPGRRAADRA